MYRDITEAEMMPLAMLGKVVSPVTSYLAIEPGVRPSTEGLEAGEGSGMGFGSGSASFAGGVRRGNTAISIDKEKFLRDALEKGLAQCGGKGRKAKTSLETTLDEIVSVQTTIEGEAAGSKLASCFEESAWEIYLPGDFRAEREVFTIAL
jgi:hypothetical protein